MSSGNRKPRRGPGLEKVLAVSVPTLVSLFGWWSVLAVLPSWAAVLVLAAVVASVSVALLPAAESVVVRLLYRGRPVAGVDVQMLSETMALLCRQGLGPPGTRFYVGPAGSAVPVLGVGRRSVVIDRGVVDALRRAQLTPVQAATSIAPAAALVNVGATRTDCAVLIWVLPWTVLREAGTVVVRAAGLSALLRLGWRTRWVVVAVAAFQAVQASRPGWAVVVAAIFAVTCGWPRWVAAWHARLVGVGEAAAERVRRGAGAGRLAGAGPDRPHRGEPTPPRTKSGAPVRAVDGRPRLTLVR